MNTVDFCVLPTLNIDTKNLEYYRNLKFGTDNNGLSWIKYITETCNQLFAGLHTLKKVKSCLAFHINIIFLSNH